jgi:hypothetical protein
VAPVRAFASEIEPNRISRMVRLRLRIDRMASPEGGTYEIMCISSSGQLSDRTEATLSDRSGVVKVPFLPRRGRVVGQTDKDGAIAIQALERRLLLFGYKLVR